MTHLCYTLDEAAERLNLSETVLVRLSQYFKVPQDAYEEIGTMSFKGDLGFSDQDLAFFRQVREHLLEGESLEEVKARIRYEHIPAAAPQPPVQAQTYETPRTIDAQPIDAQPVNVQPSQPARAAQQAPMPQPARPAANTTGMSSPIREVIDRAPFEKAAQQNLAKYKESQRFGIGRVFENMLKEVQKPATMMQPLRMIKESFQNRSTGFNASPQPAPQSFAGPTYNPDDLDTEAVDRDSLLPFRPIRRNRQVQEAAQQNQTFEPIVDPAPQLRQSQPAAPQSAFQDMIQQASPARPAMSQAQPAGRPQTAMPQASRPVAPIPQAASQPMVSTPVTRPSVGMSAQGMSQPQGMSQTQAPVRQQPVQQPAQPVAATPYTAPTAPVGPSHEIQAGDTYPAAQPTARPRVSPPLEPTLDHMLRQAPAQPRALNRQLKSAASQLRERTQHGR